MEQINRHLSVTPQDVKTVVYSQLLTASLNELQN